jgi:hypothetical protein
VFTHWLCTGYIDVTILDLHYDPTDKKYRMINAIYTEETYVLFKL